jgi:hypothetical protein
MRVYYYSISPLVLIRLADEADLHVEWREGPSVRQILQASDW